MNTPTCSTGSCSVPLHIALPAVLRLTLGGLFILAGFTKLQNPAIFAGAINKFDLGIYQIGGESLLGVLAFSIPWAEIIIGTLLILGLWTRAAAACLTGLLIAFTIGIISVISRGKAVDCGCFGQLKLFCGNADIGPCHIIRNAVMLAVALLILWLGPGLLSLDARSRPKQYQ